MATQTNKESTRFSSLKIQAPRTDAQSIAKVPVTVKGVSGQTGDLVQVQDSAGSNMFKVTAAGAATVAGALTATGGLIDTNGLSRLLMNPTTKAVPDGAATALIDIACAAGAMIGGIILFTVEASDGTDHQALSGVVSYSAVNKAGTHTCTVTQLSTVEAKAVSSGTLTLAWTHVTGTNKTTVKLQPTGSLTETVERITYTVLPIIGAVTIL